MSVQKDSEGDDRRCFTFERLYGPVRLHRPLSTAEVTAEYYEVTLPHQLGIRCAGGGAEVMHPPCGCGLQPREAPPAL